MLLHAAVLMLASSQCWVLQRANTVKIKAQDENGAKVSLSLTDWQARIFQHEYDHLQVCCCQNLPGLQTHSIASAMMLAGRVILLPLIILLLLAHSCQHVQLTESCVSLGLQGTLFHDRMNKEEFQKVMPELIFMEKLFQKHNPEVQIQSVSQS